MRGEKPQVDDWFGDLVAISGNYALVLGYDFLDVPDGESETQNLYFFERIAGEWRRTQRIVFPEERYISSLAMSGEYAFVGDSFYEAPGNDETTPGRVYVFNRTERGTWEEVQILEGDDDTEGPINQYFGETINVSDNFIAVHYDEPNRSSTSPRTNVRIFQLQDDQYVYHSTFQGFDTPYSHLDDNLNDASNFAFDGLRIIADMVWGEAYGSSGNNFGRVVFDYNDQTGEWEDTFIFEDGAYDAQPPNNITFNGDALVLRNDVAVFTTTEYTPSTNNTFNGSTGPTHVYRRNSDGSWGKTEGLAGDGLYTLSNVALTDNYLIGSDYDTIYAFTHDGSGNFTRIAAVQKGADSQTEGGSFGALAIDGSSAVVEYYRYYEDDTDYYDLPGSVIFYDFVSTFALSSLEIPSCQVLNFQPEVTADCAVEVTTDSELPPGGPYLVNWTAVDAAGNRAIATQTVTVTDATVSLPLTEAFSGPSALPCWTVDPAWEPSSGSYRLMPGGQQTETNRLALPSLALQSGTTYGFAFRYHSVNPSGGGRLQVVGPEGALFDDASAPAEYQYVEMLLTVGEDDTYSFSFQSPRGEMDQGLELDEVSLWEYEAPTANGAARLAGAADGNCLTVTAQGVSGYGWQRVLTQEGALLAEINANGNDLGDVEVGLADYADAPTAPFTGAPQLGRYYSMQPGNGKGPYPANGGVRIRLYVTDAELDELETASGQSLAWENLAVTHYSGANDDCDLLNSSDAEFATEAVTATGDYGTTAHYVEFTTQTFSEFGLTYQQAVGITPPGAQPLSGLDAFPNPTGDRVTVRLTTDYNGTVRLRLTDLLGRPVQTAILKARPGNNDLPLDLTGLPAGTYHVHAVAGSRAGTLRILKR